jgi:hypothetical protein
VLVCERGSCAISKLCDRDNINAVEVVSVPVLHLLDVCCIGTVGRQKCAHHRRNLFVLPHDKNECVVITRAALLKRSY